MKSKSVDADIEVQRWQLEHIRSAIRQAEAGQLIAHEDVKKMVKAWRQQR